MRDLCHKLIDECGDTAPRDPFNMKRMFKGKIPTDKYGFSGSVQLVATGH